jgi:transcriptional regulator with XRE-family HTH domain
MDLALDAGVSPRHLSFVETGRSKPSPELLLGLADVLEVPLRERNAFLLAAGYAPHYRQRSLEDPSMARVRAAVDRLLESHNPYPGVAVDLLWNVVLANDAAQRLMALLPAELVGPPLNVFRVWLHPEGLARRTLNFSEWSAYLLSQLHRLQVLTADPEVSKLADEVARYPTVVGLRDWRDVARADEPAILVPWRLRLDSVELSLFTTLTTFGTPQDITLAELAVELFYPADEVSEAALRRA